MKDTCVPYFFKVKYGRNSLLCPFSLASGGNDTTETHTQQQTQQRKGTSFWTKMRLFYIHCSAICFSHLNYHRQQCNGGEIAQQ